MTSAMYRQEIETTGFYMEFIVKPPKKYLKPLLNRNKLDTLFFKNG